MLYIACPTPGDSSALVLAEAPAPVPGPDDVLIRVTAAGVNRADLLQRMGRYDPPSGASPIIGLEVAGTVAARGRAVTAWSVGAAVCALVAGGGYAEYCVAPAAQCLPVPAGLTPVQAAALPEACFTVWTNVVERGRLRSGETLLVHGGASGIGTLAIQLAHARGARVFATAGTAAKCQACEALGATAINYRETDFVAAIARLTDGRGVDLILDMVGGPYLERNLQALAVDGRLVHIAHMQGNRVEIDLAAIMRKRLTVTGSTLRGRSVAEKGAIARALHAEVWPLVESGRVRPVVYRTFPLAEAAAAQRLMESDEHTGKIVLTV
jgi:putative PIG3 family NAD(P)H quinone oxidoreductase